MGDVLRFPARLPPFELSPEQLRAIQGMAQQLGGLIDAGAVPVTDAPPRKALVADGERFVWQAYPAITEPPPEPKVRLGCLGLQLTGDVDAPLGPAFRPFHGVVWMLTPKQRARLPRRTPRGR